LAVGWFWFLGTLVPAIGLVQVGVQSMADRYSYLPSIGIFLLVAWGMNDLFERWPDRKKFLPIIAGVALAGCLAVTELQLSYWRNSLTIFLHTVEVTTDNYAADDCLGKSLENIGKTDAAAQYYDAAVQIEPDYPMGQFDLGFLDMETGKTTEASNHLAIAANLAPGNAEMQFDFGVFLVQHGSPAQAAGRFKAALAARPDFPEAQQQLEQLEHSTNSAANRSTP
jgi:predicted Zn-dependent protease